MTKQWQPPRRDPKVTRCLYLKPEDPEIRARREARQEKLRRAQTKLVVAGLREIADWIKRRSNLLDRAHPWERLAVDSLQYNRETLPSQWQKLLTPVERDRLRRLRRDIQQKRNDRWRSRQFQSRQQPPGVQTCVDNVRLRGWRTLEYGVVWTPLAPGFAGALYRSKVAAVAAVHGARERALLFADTEWCAPQ